MAFILSELSIDITEWSNRYRCKPVLSGQSGLNYGIISYVADTIEFDARREAAIKQREARK